MLTDRLHRTGAGTTLCPGVYFSDQKSDRRGLSKQALKACVFLVLKSQCRNISRISNQFQKIEFWFIPTKQPLERLFQKMILKISHALCIWRILEKFENSQKMPFLFMKLVIISNDFKERVRARNNSC